MKKISFKKAVKLIRNGEVAIMKDCDNFELMKSILEKAFPENIMNIDLKFRMKQKDIIAFESDSSNNYWLHMYSYEKINSNQINLSQIKQPKVKIKQSIFNELCKDENVRNILVKEPKNVSLEERLKALKILNDAELGREVRKIIERL